jgi:hypothetical protein
VNVMKKCLYCWLFEPIHDSFEDSSDSIPSFSIPVHSDGRTSVLSLFADDRGRPLYVRMEIPRLEQEAIPDEMGPVLQTTKEHLLTVLRFTYDPQVKLFPYSLWSFVDEGQDYKWGVDITRKFGCRTLDVDRTRRVFAGSWKQREEVRLLSDGVDERIPAQYRYLSLYKILEIHYKHNGRWRQNELEKFLEEHRSVFTSAGLTKSPRRLIHTLRDKCAHIRTGSNNERLGVTHLNQKDLIEVNQVLTLLETLCVSILNSRADGAFDIRLPTRSAFDPQEVHVDLG